MGQGAVTSIFGWCFLCVYIHMTHIDRGAVKQVTKIWQGVRDDDEGYQVMDEG